MGTVVGYLNKIHRMVDILTAIECEIGSHVVLLRQNSKIWCRYE